MRRPWLPMTVALVSAVVALGAPPDPSTHEAEYDCGTMALYLLARLERKDLSLKQVESALPPPPREGYSLAALRDAARASGFVLRGVKLAGPASLDRPALVFVKAGGVGHYDVIRPIGHTGKLIQLPDSDRPPVVLDAARLHTSPEWAGFALVPERVGGFTPLVCAAAGWLALAVVSWLSLMRTRRAAQAIAAGPDLEGDPQRGGSA
jgi:hypothetical protein